MPERVTKEERMVSLAIEKARKAKEELSAKKRMNIEPTQVLEVDTDPEVEKIKRPKVQDVKTKITNNDGTHSGYGLAGESLKKQDKPKRMVSFKNTTKDVRSADSYLSPEKRRESDLPKETKEMLEDLSKKLLDSFRNIPNDEVLMALTTKQRKFMSADEFKDAMVKLTTKASKKLWDGTKD
jgi:hypothetical protein